MAFSLKYNGVASPSFLKITGVDQYLLPKIDHYNSKITGSYGNIDGGITYGDKVFKVHYTIVYDGIHDDSYYIDNMAIWLIGNNSKVSKLQLDTSGEYYLARVSDATDFSDAVTHGSGSITFTASNPRRYAASATSVSLTVSGKKTIAYTGYIPALPVFTITATSDGLTSLRIANNRTGDYVLITGTLKGTIVIDCNKKFVSVDGTKDMTLLTTDSDWINLLNGNNEIQVSCQGTAPSGVTMKYTVTK